MRLSGIKPETKHNNYTYGVSFDRQWIEGFVTSSVNDITESIVVDLIKTSSYTAIFFLLTLFSNVYVRIEVPSMLPFTLSFSIVVITILLLGIYNNSPKRRAEAKYSEIKKSATEDLRCYSVRVYKKIKTVKRNYLIVGRDDYRIKVRVENYIYDNSNTNSMIFLFSNRDKVVFSLPLKSLDCLTNIACQRNNLKRIMWSDYKDYYKFVFDSIIQSSKSSLIDIIKHSKSFAKDIKEINSKDKTGTKK